MRLSCDDNDPGYQAWEERHPVKVFLDGVEMDRCITADTDEGYILRFRCHPDGRVVVDNGVVCKEELYGVVTIEPLML